MYVKIMLHLQRVSGTIDPSQIGGISDPFPSEGEPQPPARTEATTEFGETVFNATGIANEGFSFVKLDR